MKKKHRLKNYTAIIENLIKKLTTLASVKQKHRCPNQWQNKDKSRRTLLIERSMEQTHIS